MSKVKAFGLALASGLSVTAASAQTNSVDAMIATFESESTSLIGKLSALQVTILVAMFVILAAWLVWKIVRRSLNKA